MLFTFVSVVLFFIGLTYGFTSEFFYVTKTITLFQYTAFLAFAFFVTSLSEELKRSSKQQVYLIIGFFVAMLSFYEVLFNFFYWFSLYNFYGLGTNIDAVRALIQSNLTIFNMTNAEILNKTGLYPINLNFISKISVLIFFCSLYWIYLIDNLRKK